MLNIQNLPLRKSFGKVKRVIDIPHLIEVQQKPYEKFLQKDVAPEARRNAGLQAVFKSVFPINDFTGASSLEFVQYTIGEPKYSQEECLARGSTYEAPVKIVIRLLSYDVDKETGVQSIRDIKEQEIYFGTIPLMTRTGTFIINGTERVVVSQLQRSPGVFFDHDKGKTHSSGKLLYSCRVIPVRGSWLDFEFDPKSILYVRIDRRKKFPATILLKAIGLSTDDILREFYEWETYYLEGKLVYRKVIPELLKGQRASLDVINPETGDVILKQNRKFSKAMLRKFAELGIERVPVEEDELIGKITATDVIDLATGEILIPKNTPLTEGDLAVLRDNGVTEIQTLFIDGIRVSSSIRDTLLLDKRDKEDIETTEDAILEIYRRLRPSSPSILEVAEKFFHSLFFNPDTYDLSDDCPWPLVFRDIGDTMDITSISVNFNSSEDFIARVTIPGTATPGQSGFTNITAVSQNASGVNETVTIDSIVLVKPPWFDDTESGSDLWDAWDGGWGTIWELGVPNSTFILPSGISTARAATGLALYLIFTLHLEKSASL